MKQLRSVTRLRLLVLLLASLLAVAAAQVDQRVNEPIPEGTF